MIKPDCGGGFLTGKGRKGNTEKPRFNLPQITNQLKERWVVCNQEQVSRLHFLMNVSKLKSPWNQYFHIAALRIFIRNLEFKYF